MSGPSCPVCGTPLVIPPTGRRPVYCGTPCRQAAYRARAAAARAARDADWAREQLAAAMLETGGLARQLDDAWAAIPPLSGQLARRDDDGAALAAGRRWEAGLAEAARELARAAYRTADLAGAHARAAGACRAARATGFRSGTGAASSNDGTLTAATTADGNGAAARRGSVAQVAAAAAATEPGSPALADLDALFDAAEDIVTSAHPDTAAGSELPAAVTAAVEDLAAVLDATSGAGPYTGLIAAARRVLDAARAGTHPIGAPDLIDFLAPAWDALDRALPGTAEAAR